MNKINIFFGEDSIFTKQIGKLKTFFSLGDILDHVIKTEISIEGIKAEGKVPFEVENLVIYTDDYGALKEWAMIGFSNNILKCEKLNIHNLWINNPPKKIYDDLCRAYPDIIEENKTQYSKITIDILKDIATNYDKTVIGQQNIIKQILSSLYILKNNNRKKPVTLLFLGESGVGKTETAKLISSYLGNEMVRVQFSMQQTNNAYQFIFGAEHGENSLARELIRRSSNIILLDEFDKVHPSFYNAFYQMFDEGVFVDSNYCVNVEQCIIICTTNYTSESEAERYLGTPIYSRFTKVIKFNSISIEDRIKIAENSYKSIITQLDDDDKELIKNNKIMEFFYERIREGYYKNIRMLSNDIEDAISFEILKEREIIII